MFFFTASTKGSEARSFGVALNAPGRARVITQNSCMLFWWADKFTKLYRKKGRVTIELKRPGIDDAAICKLEWYLDSGQIVVWRQWSGEFSTYFGRQPALTITSHLRLAALAHNGLPSGMRPLKAGFRLCVNALHPTKGWDLSRTARFQVPFRLDRRATTTKVKRLVFSSVARHPGGGALLLSGGLDSAVIAAIAVKLGKSFRAFVFSADLWSRLVNQRSTDLGCARTVAKSLGFQLSEIRLHKKSLVRNVPLAVLLTETRRGTLVDVSAALVDVARLLHKEGIRTAWLGEGADALFGGFGFALRYHRGAALKRYCRHHLEVSLPDELAALQRVFAYWDISLIYPFWTRKLMELGYNLPLAYRFDSRRLMKMVLRNGFHKLLPQEIVNRPKGIPRDNTGVRRLLEERFGTSRERYLPIFRQTFHETGQ